MGWAEKWGQRAHNDDDDLWTIWWIEQCLDLYAAAAIAPYTWGTPPLENQTGRDNAQADTDIEEGGK